MGNKKSNNNNNKRSHKEEARIITTRDKPINVEYTFVDDGLTKLNPPTPSQDNGDNLSKELKKRDGNDIAYSLRRHSDKLKRTDNNNNKLLFKSSNKTKARSKQNHSPVYE